MSKVMVAMSGGVDSSVAAFLLKEQQHDICGATLKLFDNDDIGITDTTRTCCSLTDISDARSVCYKLDVAHHAFNFSTKFKKEVIGRFVQGYQQGITPNPCIDCNQYIKFDAFLARANELSYDYLATGHYAQIVYDGASGRYLLTKAVDATKDQSYVLYTFTQAQLSKTLLPLGGLPKSKVRDIASKQGLATASKPDSQDICFVKDGDYAKFIEDYSGKQSQTGYILDTQGKIVGTHQGVLHYTIGQRRGLGVSSKQRMFVCHKDMEKHSITIGTEQDLYTKTLTCHHINLIAVKSLTGSIRAKAKIRYNGTEQPALLHQISDDEIRVEFDNPQRAITPGQSVVFYDNEVVLGGGVIR